MSHEPSSQSSNGFNIRASFRCTLHFVLLKFSTVYKRASAGKPSILDFLFAEAGDPDRGEVGESFPIAISFIENDRPTQPSLGALQDEELEVLVVIVDRNSPFVVVVFQIEVSHPLSPGAAFFDFGFSFHSRFNWSVYHEHQNLFLGLIVVRI